MIKFYCHWRENLGNWASPDDLLVYWPSKVGSPWNAHKLVEDIKSWPGSARYFRVDQYHGAVHGRGHYLVFAGNVNAMQDCQGIVCMSLGTIQQINQGLLDLTLFFVHETFDDWEFDHWVRVFYQRLEKLGISRPGCVKVVLGTKLDHIPQHPVVRWIFYPWFAALSQQTALRQLPQGRPDLVDPNSKPQRFLSLTGADKPHRYLLIKYLEWLGCADQGVITWNHNHVDRDPGSLLSALPEFQAWLHNNPGGDPRYISVQDPSTGIKKGWFAAAKFYEQAGWDVIQEYTADLAQGVFLTEKPWRSMLMGVPFVINGGRGSLRVLRDLGYQTFDGIIDESYDDIADPGLRIQAVAHQVQRICTQSLPWHDIEPRVRHNQDLAWREVHLARLHELLSA